MLDQHVNHPYCLLNGETKQTNATKCPVHGSSLSLHIPIYAQKGKAVEVFGAEVLRALASGMANVAMP